jgi:DNA-binding FrmR family transcriptional regulator
MGNPAAQSKTTRRTQTLSHLNRIMGQLRVLKEYIAEDKPCRDVAHLTASITRSFETLKVRTLEGFILHELLEGRPSGEKTEQLTELLKLYKR